MGDGTGKFEELFRVLSYAAAVCGFLALAVSGTFAPAESLAFVAVVIAAWFLENKRWQLSERVGTALIVLAIPFFYLLWKFHIFTVSTNAELLPGLLGRLILSLSAIKLLQKKTDRDWIFLYLMAFFEVLLGAGLSISIFYFASIVLYIFVMTAVVVLFEIRKTSNRMASLELSSLGDADGFAFRRLPTISIPLVVLMIIIAAPIFFALPRVGSGFGGRQGGLQTSSGFSDRVRLGGIGSIQQNDEVVMRVSFDPAQVPVKKRRWRGVALDRFDNLSWSKSHAAQKEPFARDERGLIQVGRAAGRDTLVQQTIYLEPLDTPVIFALPGLIALQTELPYVFRDRYGAVGFQGRGERIFYKAVSDVAEPLAEDLRADESPYPHSMENYLQLPESLDRRIPELAAEFTRGTTNRFDAASAIERHLQNDFGYTLEQKAGGDDPLADFLFNVREGHCEYFATAMAIMLRTQGIATRVVNGFSQGEYNDAADVWVVRQLNAHSWVEVYFPATNTWETFDPTPFDGQGGGYAANGIGSGFAKYMEAIETYWIQYFVAFDSQGQRTLMSSLRRGFISYQESVASYASTAKFELSEWWSDVRGEHGFEVSLIAIAKGAAYVVGVGLLFGILFWVYRKLAAMKLFGRAYKKLFGSRNRSAVEFYDRMTKALAKKGLVRPGHQTPLEFAAETGIPEALEITGKYNRVRFGGKDLSNTEADEVEKLLQILEEKK
jgi:transglutaminase-like putative cysteine protease